MSTRRKFQSGSENKQLIKRVISEDGEDDTYTGATGGDKATLDDAVETTGGHYTYTPAFFAAVVTVIIYFGVIILSGIEIAGSNLISVTHWAYMMTAVAAVALANTLVAVFAIISPTTISSQTIKVYMRIQWFEYVRWALLTFFIVANTTFAIWLQWNDYRDKLSLSDWQCTTVITQISDVVARADCQF